MNILDELERLERDYREELRTCALCLEMGQKTWPNRDLVTRRQKTALDALPALFAALGNEADK